MDHMKEIDKIKKEISRYHQMSFKSESEDYQFNRALKEKLQQVIIDFAKDDDIIREALLTLAETTGCAEDQQICEQILDNLYAKSYINNGHLDYFYKHLATGRWL
jgi:predicted house-cleaning noncanonical NTP pyrophosphatase (MazG superfamily)